MVLITSREILGQEIHGEMIQMRSFANNIVLLADARVDPERPCRGLGEEYY